MTARRRSLGPLLLVLLVTGGTIGIIYWAVNRPVASSCVSS